MFKISLISQTFFKSLSLLDICVFEQNVIFLLIDFNMHLNKTLFSETKRRRAEKTTRSGK